MFEITDEDYLKIKDVGEYIERANNMAKDQKCELIICDNDMYNSYDEQKIDNYDNMFYVVDKHW